MSLHACTHCILTCAPTYSPFPAGEVVDLEDYDPNVVASLLKLYLRELPDPLVSPRVTAKLESATSKNACLVNLIET